MKVIFSTLNPKHLMLLHQVQYLGSVWLTKMVITFLYLFLEFKYRKNDQFSHLCLFGNLESILDTQFKYKIHHYPVWQLFPILGKNTFYHLIIIIIYCEDRNFITLIE